MTVSGLDGGGASPVPVPESICQEALPADSFASRWASGCESEARTGSYARFYTFTLDGESEVTIALTSETEGVDSYLYLRSGTAQSGSHLYENDDHEGSTSVSRISETLSAGTYTIEVTTYNAGEAGNFFMTVSGLDGGGASPVPVPESICQEALPADSFASRWAPGCESEARTGSYARFYTFTLDGESEVTITLTSETQGVDSYLYLRSGTAQSGSHLYENDDHEGSTSVSQIQETLSAGTYTIEVTTYNAGEAGNFFMTVSGLDGGGASPVPVPESICQEALPADSFASRWASGCESEARTGSYARFYTFTLDGESEVTIALTSETQGVDPYLYLRSGTAQSGSHLYENDDHEGSTSVSQIQETLSAGTYTIEATTYNAGEAGNFFMTVSGADGGGTAPVPDSVCRQTLPADSFASRWASGCESEARTGSYARFYTFTLDGESEVTITLEAVDDVDTYLYLRSGTAQSGSHLYDNDDHDGSTSVSQIQETLVAGTYTIEATTYNAGETGGFTLTVSRRDPATAPTGPGPDLAVQSPSVNASSAEPGGSFTLSVFVSNQGAVEAESTTLRYYHSTDSTISGGDTEVGTDTVSSLRANGISRESVDLTAPLDIGTNYYGACVDSVEGESDTENNCSSSVAVTVTGGSLTAPDLVVQSPSVNISIVEPGGSFTLSATVSNQGVGATASTTLRFFRSTDSAISTADTQVGTDSVSSLGPNGTSSQSIILTAPSDLGTYYYGACVDAVVDESSTENNCSSDVAVTVATATSGSPDLRTLASVSEDLLRTGGSFVLRATVSNQGNRGGGTSASTTLRYYRSTDSAISSTDTELGTEVVRALSLGQNSSLSIDLTAPASRGTYYYGACVDTVPGESNTQNDCSDGVEVTVEDTFPDLVVESPSVSDSNLETGESFTLSVTVHNQGDGTASSTTLRYYRSTDSTISSSDAFLDTDPVSSLGSGETSSESDSLSAPTSAGTYYYGACVDSVPSESNTGNNCSAGVQVTVTGDSQPSPDLVVQSPSVSDNSVKPGDPLTLSATVRNQGDGSSAATTLRYYRSTDRDIGTSDTLEGTDPLGVLAASGTSAQSVDLTVPTDPDTYYYGACAVAVSGESNTQNNCSAGVQVTVEEVYPDLVVDTPTVDENSLETGEGFRLSATVRNQGDGRPSSNTTLRYYRSTDSTISSSDTEVGTDDVARVRPASTDSNNIDLTAPASAGTYYYGACVDAVQQESNTQNNCSGSVEVTVTQGNPDLVVESSSVDDSNPVAGTIFRLRATIKNQGDRSSPATTVRFYRSTDSTISSSDTEVATEAVRSLEPSQTSNEFFDLTAPAIAGTYYYGACVDSVTDESDSGNNCSSSVTVTVTGTATTAPDLVVESPSVDDKHLDPDDNRDDDFRLTVTVRNQGDGASPEATVRYYRSTDSTITTGDTEVDTDTADALTASETDEVNTSNRFPNLRRHLLLRRLRRLGLARVQHTEQLLDRRGGHRQQGGGGQSRPGG